MSESQSAGEFIIEGDHFEVIRQLTRQMANVNRDFMVEQGWTRDVDTLLYALVKSVPRDVEPQARIRIRVGEGETDTPNSQVKTLRANEEAVRHIPTYICKLWPVLLAATWEKLGSLEARYRTGFNADEITAALTSMTAAVEEALEV
ncbi:hypothetical protein [Nocardia arizonensis]|uniref:hypothetical protein n=1 Tax=Nocardia arizonensis TaxID=1141647 RepID=UPI0006D08772|nr:hypothetical protein [Nocardia arizonensis]